MFVEANHSAVYPDGRKALSAAADALTQIQCDLEAIYQFWHSTSEICQIIMAKVLSDGPKINVQQAMLYAEAWIGYQEALTHAIKAIARSCDAITVNAVGAPPGCPDQLSSPSIPYMHGNKPQKAPHSPGAPKNQKARARPLAKESQNDKTKGKLSKSKWRQKKT